MIEKEEESLENSENGKGIEDSPRDRTRLSDICADVKISQIMSKETTVVRDTEPIENIIELMTRTPYHSFPVLNSDDELVGVIDQENILELLFFERSHRTHHTHLMAIKALSEEAATLMVHHPVTISHDASLCEAADLMIKHHINRMCVVDGKKLVGVISKSDLIKKIYELRR
ncbi:CBS domain-containing protein [Methanolobus mangrovi]|uniref:CBS domain-containing protein n=1 Tax=Methanolobus mangrovi TaxID=3072977 RepID=A0AA51UF15_9EURY|nr:CBS domain-containing protein [Methanolobus mangrovi]WMW21958.1 CBS domain-containing protein [Methanolobus mangrovi]